MPILHRRALLAAPVLLAAPALLPGAGARAQTKWQMATAYPDGNFHTRNIRESAPTSSRPRAASWRCSCTATPRSCRCRRSSAACRPGRCRSARSC
ncbi:hypothetical protein ACFQY5_01850 [Paeniroseomonas aquatica]|uniref:hypothetical protein n=1 Tax=Paeniroseomonas aquatica TaxID=373043 RepID=UPI00361FD5DB